MPQSALTYRVGFLGAPNSQEKGRWTVAVEWNAANIDRLKNLGFNAIQLNVAWGRRPGDEPLNLEDVVELTPEQQVAFPQVVPLLCDPSPERRAARRADLTRRIALCRQAGLRTIFHFGAPYNAHCRYGDTPPNCLCDEKVIRRYELLLQTFAHEFSGVDDILLYTYDQDAWLCSEFDRCPRCVGVPLHQRVVPFVDRLAAEWRKHSVQGRLWWEPWELSAGQVLACVDRLNPAGLGLSLHANIAEAQATLVADRWLKNTAALAAERDIPVIVEYFLGACSEELESFSHLAHPLVTLRALQSIADVRGVCGIKEYFGLVPDREDANLRMAGLFFANSTIGENGALLALARPYAGAALRVIEFWRHTSAAMELFPWDLSWYIREIGRSDPAHAVTAAMLRGQQAHTPSWESTRRAIFMKTDNGPCDPWMLEDVQLRCQLAADRWGKALQIGREIESTIPAELRSHFHETLIEVAAIRRRALAYAFRIRQTNLAGILRSARERGEALPAHALAELEQVLAQDVDNCRAEKPCPEIENALALLRRDAGTFLDGFFLPALNSRSKGHFSVTSA